jgi:major membrane immunogen (membrane-anchored lipoprotein)
MPWKSTVGALTLLTLFGVLLIGCGSSKTTITTADGKGEEGRDHEHSEDKHGRRNGVRGDL